MTSDNSYYHGKLDLLKDVFGAKSIALTDHCLDVDGKCYPIVDDVIILLDPSQYPESLKRRLFPNQDDSPDHAGSLARDIQFTFGEEWQMFDRVLPEHEHEFQQYFDLVDIDALAGQRVCDLGCGVGRWSYFLRDVAGELVLIDFSEAIFVARRNFRGADNAVFFMADLQNLPFRRDFADFGFCLGVAHHLPTNALDAVRDIARYSPRLLVYLYSALDARPAYYRTLLHAVTWVRKGASRVTNRTFRSVFAWMGTLFIYLPLVWLGILLKPVGLSSRVPLYDFYSNKSIKRIRQDVYDRFFTRIEQRFSRSEITSLQDSFSRITVSSGIPYWHFLCER